VFPYQVVNSAWNFVNFGVLGFTRHNSQMILVESLGNDHGVQMRCDKMLKNGPLQPMLVF